MPATNQDAIVTSVPAPTAVIIRSRGATVATLSVPGRPDAVVKPRTTREAPR